MDGSVAKRTQETLGRIIKKPPLTEKLLSKPPFRFLHDIITEVIKNTGFLKGLYTTEEMNSANVKEKDAKIIFLQKAIDCVVMVSGDSLSVRPSKVVAGQEADKTNEFLQAIARAVSSKKDSADAVKKVLAGEKPSKSDSKKKELRTGSGSREREKSKDRDKTREAGSAKRDREKKEGESSRRKESSSKGNSDERKRREDSGRKDKDKDRDKERTERERERQREKEREKEKEKEREKVSKGEEEPHVDDLHVDGDAVVNGNAEDGDMPPNRIPRPSSAKGQRRRPQDETEDSLEGENDGTFGTDDGRRPTDQMNGVMNDEDELPPQVTASRRMPRPSSARPAPPKMKKKQDELDEPAARIGSGKEVANVIVDNGKDDDEDDTFVVDDSHLQQQNHTDSIPTTEGTDNDGEHGGLVRKILETKKELEGSGPQESRPRHDRTAPLISDAARRKERELAQKEIEKLRTSIQTLTRSANPLGKIMDYIQEDMDSMQKELEMWRRENKDHAIALTREESITESEVEPLKDQLKELGTEITEMVDRISTVKCNILKNDEKIQKMLGSISFSSR